MFPGRIVSRKGGVGMPAVLRWRGALRSWSELLVAFRHPQSMDTPHRAGRQRLDVLQREVRGESAESACSGYPVCRYRSFTFATLAVKI